MIQTTRAEALARAKCDFLRERTDVVGCVFGEGSPEARLVIVGEAPGPEEERAGRPFVGRAGRLLDRLLTEAGIRREDIYITNVVKHRPTKLVEGQYVTRTPTTREAKEDLPWLDRELAIVSPKVVLCLGIVAANAMIHKGFRVFEERGKWFEGRSESLCVASFHPACLNRPFGRDREEMLRLARQDFAMAAAAARED